MGFSAPQPDGRESFDTGEQLSPNHREAVNGPEVGLPLDWPPRQTAQGPPPHALQALRHHHADRRDRTRRGRDGLQPDRHHGLDERPGADAHQYRRRPVRGNRPQLHRRQLLHHRLQRGRGRRSGGLCPAVSRFHHSGDSRPRPVPDLPQGDLPLRGEDRDPGAGLAAAGGRGLLRRGGLHPAAGHGPRHRLPRPVRRGGDQGPGPPGSACSSMPVTWACTSRR